jgi:hypothetical protein
MAGDKIPPPVFKPGKLAAIKRNWEKVDQKPRPGEAARPANPKLVERNKRHREIWDKRSRESDELIRKQPEDIEYAGKRHRKEILKKTSPGEQEDIVEIVLELAERDRKRDAKRDPERDREAQARRGRGHGKRDDDAIDLVIDASPNKSAAEIWDVLLKEADSSDGKKGSLSAESDKKHVGIIIDERNGACGRTLSERWFGSAVSRRRGEGRK